ncbi:hypothetical protein [Ferruginibacter sp. SUN106]|uniref:hypothetical protein n=1 Tax=Ferruginibacter sp. SUN106 TaxID=2978348 RepID=UPI003D365559
MRIFYITLLICVASCAEKTKAPAHTDNLISKTDTAKTTVSIPETDRDNSWVPFQTKYSFGKLSARLYTGKLAKPDFKSVDFGNEKGFKEFLTERLKGMPINFGGKYTVVEKSCGTMCVAIYMVDRITGKIFVFPVEGDGKWGYRYQQGSNLLVGNSELLNDSMNLYLDQWQVKPEFYKWTGTKFESLR